MSPLLQLTVVLSITKASVTIRFLLSRVKSLRIIQSLRIQSFSARQIHFCSGRLLKELLMMTSLLINYHLQGFRPFNILCYDRMGQSMLHSQLHSQFSHCNLRLSHEWVYLQCIVQFLIKHRSLIMDVALRSYL